MTQEVHVSPATPHRYLPKSRGNTRSRAGTNLSNFFVPKRTVQGSSSRDYVFFDKLTVVQLVTKFPAFYGSSVFIDFFISACHWCLS
jgi:hypothetical protein